MRDHVGSRGYKDDTTQIVLSFFSEKGKVISKIMSEEVAVSAHWVEFEKSDVIPLGAVGAKLELLSRYRHGAENNDGYFDDLYFGMSRLGNR
jgi:hypothetical protein